MYLTNSTDLDGILTFGIDPLIELMNIFEDEIQEDLEPRSREAILWTELKAKAFSIREAAKKINKANLTRKRLDKNNPGKE